MNRLRLISYELSFDEFGLLIIVIKSSIFTTDSLIVIPFNR